MVEFLIQNPDSPFDFLENNNAATLLLEVGIIGKFLKNPTPAEPWFSIVCKNDVSHFIIGVLYTGFPNEKDNGYVAHCLPKSEFSPKQAAEWVAGKYRENCEPATVLGMILAEQQSQN